MCTCDRYTYVYPDNSQSTSSRQTTLCANSRHGMPCADNVVYQYPPQHVPFPGQAASAPAASPTYLSAQFPPSPAYTPRSGTPNYRSGDESDRSAGYRSGSSSRSRRASGYYADGTRVYESTRRGERVIRVDAPPSPRTSSRAFGSPMTAPPSPSAPYVVNTGYPSPSRRHATRDDRPHINIEIVDAERRPRREHKRHTSSSSFSSFDEDDSARRRRKEAEKEQRREAERSARVNQRIAQANAEIANRPAAAPMPPQPPRRSQTIYGRGREEDLVDAVNRLNIRDSRRAREEDEAQRQRLEARMMPKRRNTVTGSKKHKVLFSDGTYRYD